MKVTFIDVVYGSKDDPICKEKEWDTKVIPTRAREMVNKYGLRGSFDPENPINTDYNLADEFWKAGLEFAVEVGMLCTDTDRVIKFSEDELNQCIEDAPGRLTVGSGLDEVIWLARKPEDSYPPGTCFGAFGTAISEELYVESIAVAAQYKTVDVAMTSCPLTFYGRELKGGTPYETLSARFEAEGYREALRRIDRPNMSIAVSGVDATGWGAIGMWGAPGGILPDKDWIATLPPSCLKTNYTLLNKIAYQLNFGSMGFWSATYGMIGGYSGGPEECVVTANAAAILQLPVHHAVVVGGSIYDLGTYTSSSRSSLWANSVALQGQSRNTHILTLAPINPAAGPCTEMLLQEVAAQCIQMVTSGGSFIVGTRPLEGKYPHYFSGLENGFAGELCKLMLPGMTCSEGNKVVKKLVEQYEDRLKSPPKGKKLEECTDMKTLQPSEEWHNIYLKVKDELETLGIK